MYTANFSRKYSGIDTNLYIANKFSESDTSDKLDQALYTDINSYLPDDLLVKVDIS